MSELFPLYLPADSRRLFQTESLLRRFAQQSYWNKGASLLEFHASLGGLAIARGLSGKLTVVEPDAKNAASIKDRAKAAQITGISFHEGAGIPTGPYDGVFCFSRVLGTPASLAKQWRPLLKPSGRAGYVAVVKVGRKVDAAALAFWESRLQESLLLPKDALSAVESQGYEPELIDSLSPSELDDHYKDVELHLKKLVPTGDASFVALKEEVALHQATKGQSGITYAFIVARRKEPGEKPPASRDNG